ncbi:hypothetical protein COCON_G00137100 [Conger conger]|uniref:Uncharacterized protein n=1 Tax=Conger conger TaxID=82655 RepID=A0A9Q1HW17_CONCO|nr:hypothetical protein COCON_G00137100 [Conger conger]
MGEDVLSLLFTHALAVPAQSPAHPTTPKQYYWCSHMSLQPRSPRPAPPPPNQPLPLPCLHLPVRRGAAEPSAPLRRAAALEFSDGEAQNEVNAEPQTPPVDRLS